MFPVKNTRLNSTSQICVPGHVDQKQWGAGTSCRLGRFTGLAPQVTRSSPGRNSRLLRVQPVIIQGNLGLSWETPSSLRQGQGPVCGLPCLWVPTQSPTLAERGRGRDFTVSCSQGKHLVSAKLDLRPCPGCTSPPPLSRPAPQALAGSAVGGGLVWL